MAKDYLYDYQEDYEAYLAAYPPQPLTEEEMDAYASYYLREQKPFTGDEPF